MKLRTRYLKVVVGVFLAIPSLMACSSPTDASFPVVATVTATAIPTQTSPTAVDLGLSSTLAVFGGGAGVTNDGINTIINGDLGTTAVSTKITGFHTASVIYTQTTLNVGLISGSVYSDAPQGTAADLLKATQVSSDAGIAFADLASRTGGIDPGAGQLGGLTLGTGVYKSASGAFGITGGDLTLDAKNDANAIWIFQMVSSLTIGDGITPRNVLLVNGAQAKNVYWEVGSAATVNGPGGGTVVGTIIAYAGITFSTVNNVAVTTLNGRALSLGGSVTMANTVINCP